MTLPPGHNLDLDRFVARLILWRKPDDVVQLKGEIRKLPITAVVCANGRPDLLKKLIKAGATHSLGEALVWAATANSPECVSILLDMGGNPTKRVVEASLTSGNWSHIIAFVERNSALVSESYGEGATLLHLAMDAPEVVSVVKLLLESGANPNAADRLGTTALMMAAGRGATELVTLLLDAGADPAIRNQAGQSAEGYARLRGHDEIAARLGNRASDSES